MNEPTISYAQGPGQHAMHSRLGVIAFACALASAGGIMLTMFLLGRPIPGPMGSIIRERVALLFCVVVLLLWLGGIVLSIAALRQPGRVRTFAAWALGMCGVMVLLFLTMLLIHY